MGLNWSNGLYPKHSPIFSPLDDKKMMCGNAPVEPSFSKALSSVSPSTITQTNWLNRRLTSSSSKLPADSFLHHPHHVVVMNIIAGRLVDSASFIPSS